MGASIVTDNRAALKAAYRAALEARLAAAARSCAADAAKRAPKRSGALAASVRAVRVGPGKWRVLADARDAVFVELGTRFQAAHPFLFPAFLRAAATLKRGNR